MSKNVVTLLRYESETKTLRAEPHNWCVAHSATWADGKPMDGAVDYERTMARIVACVNALQGIPTDLLEGGGLERHLLPLRDALAKLNALGS